VRSGNCLGIVKAGRPWLWKPRNDENEPRRPGSGRSSSTDRFSPYASSLRASSLTQVSTSAWSRSARDTAPRCWPATTRSRGHLPTARLPTTLVGLYMGVTRSMSRSSARAIRGPPAGRRRAKWCVSTTGSVKFPRGARQSRFLRQGCLRQEKFEHGGLRAIRPVREIAHTRSITTRGLVRVGRRS